LLASAARRGGRAFLSCGEGIPVMALLDELLSDDTLTRAWTRVRHNGGAPGVDGMDIDEFGRSRTDP
jgi:hypothetical protein